MISETLKQDVEEIIQSMFADTKGELLVIKPAAETLEIIVEAASADSSGLPEIHLVANESVLKEVMGDFIIASQAADLIEDGILSLRIADEELHNSLFVSSEAVVSLVTADDYAVRLTTDDDEFTAAAFDTYQSIWEESSTFNLRTPGISKVRESLKADLSDQTEADFETVLSSLETARGDGEGLDEVTISLLVAAKNEVLLYDISKWGEDTGIASKATFSRTKTRLEDLGLIDTEKVPIDVGRPRLRLKLGDERLRDAETDQLAGVAQSLLA